MVMSDGTSGMNVALSVFLYPELNSLCGFTEDEVSSGDLEPVLDFIEKRCFRPSRTATPGGLTS